MVKACRKSVSLAEYSSKASFDDFADEEDDGLLSLDGDKASYSDND